MKIMIIDDEVVVKRLFELRFRKEIREGLVELYFAFSGNEALTILRTNAVSDLAFILADINMPGMNGLELLAQLRQEYPNKKIFMVTAYDDLINRKRAMRLGATDYFVKPINFKILKERLLAS